MELSDVLATISIIISIALAVWTYLNEKKENKREKEFLHRSAIFDTILLNEIPSSLSNLLDDCTNIEICDQLSSLFMKLKQLSVIYYLGNKDDDYYDLRELVIHIDEQLIQISCGSDNQDEVLDYLIRNIKLVYEIIYSNAIA